MHRMSTTFNESGQTDPSPVELSEADRAAWLRIERALRGMRWWMLFLAIVAVLLGGLFLTGGVECFIDIQEIDNQADYYWMIPAAMFLVVAGSSLICQAFTMVWTTLRIRSFWRTRVLDKVLNAYFAVWLFAAAFGVGIAGFMGCIIAGYLVFRRW